MNKKQKFLNRLPSKLSFLLCRWMFPWKRWMEEVVVGGGWWWWLRTWFWGIMGGVLSGEGRACGDGCDPGPWGCLELRIWGMVTIWIMIRYGILVIQKLSSYSKQIIKEITINVKAEWNKFKIGIKIQIYNWDAHNCSQNDIKETISYWVCSIQFTKEVTVPS